MLSCTGWKLTAFLKENHFDEIYYREWVIYSFKNKIKPVATYANKTKTKKTNDICKEQLDCMRAAACRPPEVAKK